MDCLVLPVSILRRQCLGHSSRLRYRTLSDDDDFGNSDDPVTVVVGKEKREFLVEPFVLQEYPFRDLIDLVRNKEKKGRSGGARGAKRVIFVDVDAILFEHMLWLMHNDCSSLFQLNLEEIIEFYAQDY